MKIDQKAKSGVKDTPMISRYKVVSPEILAKKYYAKKFSGIHPVASIFPLAIGKDFEEICKDIEVNGLVNAIKRDKKTRLLVDGRTRLQACHATGTKPVIEDVSSEDYVDYCQSVNVARKHWTKEQLAIIAVEIAKLYEKEAKKKIGGDKKSLPKKLGNGDRKANESAVKAGTKLKVNSNYVQQAKTVDQYAPDLIEKVKTNQIDLRTAFKEAQKVKRELKVEQPRDEVKQVPLIDVKGAVVAMVNEPKMTKFNKTNDNVDWSNFSFNPITGCDHGCPFCYAREIANSFLLKSNFPVGFTPVFHEHRLTAPVNTKVPDSDDPRDKRVFVGSMSDIFGKWIPNEWIEKIFASCMANPEWEYLFLTKWPKRYNMLAALPKAWFGASVTKQAEVLNIENQMRQFTTTGIKWLSVEPMLEPIKFNDLSWCDFLVIGSQSETIQPKVGKVPAKPVEFEWVYDLVTQCKQFGVPYYLKANLDNGGTIWTKQEPKRGTKLALAS